MSAFLGIMAASIVASLISAGINVWSANANMDAQKEINAQNVQAQKDINAQNIQAQQEINQQNIDYSREFAQNGIQWKMEDLEAAGLNPVMAASGFGGTASPGTLSAPTAKAPVQQAPFMDMSGVSSALNSMSNLMLTGYILSQRNDNYSDRTSVLADKYAKNSKMIDTRQAAKYVNSAKQISPSGKSWEADWEKFLKDLEKGNFK